MFKYILVILYAALIIYAGISSRKGTADSEGFLLGGRKVGPVVSAFSYVATYVSAISFINAGSQGYMWGVGYTIIAVGMGLFGTLFVWAGFARRTRRMTQNLNAATMPSFLAARFDAKILKGLGGLVIFLFLMPLAGCMFIGLSYTFEKVYGIPYVLALVLMVGLTMIYILLGGYKAAAKADFIQGAIMLVGGIVIAVFVFIQPEVGGFANGWAKLGEINPAFTSLTLDGWGGPIMMAFLPVSVLSCINPLGMPQMTQKFFSIKDEKSIRPGMIVSTICCIIISVGIAMIGLFSRLFDLPEEAIANPELIAPILLPKIMPDFWVGFILVVLCAASVSSLAGLMLTCSGVFGEDLVKGYIKPDIEDKHLTVLMRVCVAVFLVVVFIIAVIKPASVLSLQMLSQGCIAGSFIIPFCYAVFWKGTTKAGAVAGMVSALVVFFTSALVFKQSSAMSFICAVPVSAVVVPLVSKFTPKLPDELVEKAFANREYEAAKTQD